MSRITFEIARPEDDAELRALMARNEMAGGISLSFQREPSYFLATDVQGAAATVLIAREQESGRCVGVGTRTIRPGFRNGMLAPVGYLADLRLEPAHRGGQVLARGYAKLRELHADHRTDFYFSVIAEENAAALAVLPSGRAGLPTYRDLGRILSPAINLAGKKHEPRVAWTIERATPARLPSIIECLNRNMSRRQLAPAFDMVQFDPEARAGSPTLTRGPELGAASDYPRLRDLDLSQVWIARRDDSVIGVLAHWDQRGFKQTVVTRYRGRMRFLKPLINAGAPLFRMGRLPARGHPLAFFYGALVAIDQDDTAVFHSLMLRLYNEAVGSGAMYFLVGLHDRDPLAPVLREFRRTPFHARLFAVHFEDGAAAFARLDARVPYIELGML